MHGSTPDLRHRPHEDVLALIMGTLFVAVGAVMLGMFSAFEKHPNRIAN